MGVAEDFSLFCENISINNSQKDTTSYRCKRITKQLNIDSRETDSETANSFYVGSFGRGTAISTVSDIDLIYVLPAGLYNRYNNQRGNKQSALLQAVKNCIKKTYPHTDIGADGQVIYVSFDSGTPFEVLPAFLNDDNTYTYADSNNGGIWKITNPKPEIEAIRKINDACNGNLRFLCRMMRAWKDYWQAPISGLLVDTLAYQFIQSWCYRDKSFLYYDRLTKDFLNFLASQDETQEWWRAPGSAQYAWGKGFQRKAKKCYNLAETAIKHGFEQQEWSARKAWREIYGAKYPE